MMATSKMQFCNFHLNLLIIYIKNKMSKIKSIETTFWWKNAIDAHAETSMLRSRGVLRKRCSENMQQIYRGTSTLKCDFNHFHWNHSSVRCSLVNLLDISRTLFPKDTSGGLLLDAVFKRPAYYLDTFHHFLRPFSHFILKRKNN